MRNAWSLLTILLVCTVAIAGCDFSNQKQTVPPPTGAPGPFPVDQTPAWSPDGKRIAYHHDALWTEDSTDVSGLYILDLETGATRLVVKGPARSPDWRPDGERLAFSTNTIYAINPNGSDLRQITDFGGSYFPTWSPNGTRLAFDTSYRDENGAHVVWLIDLASRNLRDISKHGVGEWRDPDWSPSGSEIVHLRFLDGVFGEEVFVMDSTGANAVRLTDNERNDRSPTWSPNSEWIAWSPLDDNGFSLWIMRPDGTDKRKLADGGRDPAWGPDSEHIVFAKPDRKNDRTALWTIHRDGSDLRQITDPSRNPVN